MGGRRARPEEKASALAMYRDGVFITEISQRTGFGTTTIYRWAVEAGIRISFTERLSGSKRQRQFGLEVRGKKGVFHTEKGGAWIPTDSTYEFARLCQLEEVKSIVKIDRCRDRIPYFLNGKARSYIPDFRIEYDSGLVVIEEVKPIRWVSDHVVRAKVQAAQEHYRSIGVVFRVITEGDIGRDRLSVALGLYASQSCPEAIMATLDRRRAQKRVAQKQYVANWKTNATPEQMKEFRAKMAAYQRKYREARKKR